MDSIHQVLKRYWGYDTFRPMQESIIQAVLDKKDTLALLPTGGGKSICFQVPALIMDGLCLVISPLIALMKDQVENLHQKGITALQVSSAMSFSEVKRTLQQAASGNCKFLYVSPERLETSLFLEFLPALPINLVAVDEAHCISQWGYDFRPSYLKIVALRQQIPGIPVLALTASATKEVQDDICGRLHFGQTQQRFQQSFERPNLSYSVWKADAKQTRLLEILKKVPGSGIVYCKSRKATHKIAALLTLHGISADYYHAGLSSEERNGKQETWIRNTTRIIVSTNAFGMGIDKADVRTVVHYDVPDCLENYYQEAGRAGRDGQKSYAVLLYSEKEPEELQAQINIRFPPAHEIKKIYIAIMNYLQIAAGSGEGTSHDFDITVFCEAFKINILTATHVLKVLEQEGLFYYNETFFKPSTVVFTAGRKGLETFHTLYPALEPVTKGLLRSYEGIMDFPAIVSEAQLARFVRQDVSSIRDALKQLNRAGIIDYSAQKEKPQLFLLQNRMYNDSFNIDLDHYRKRKEVYETRIGFIIKYLRSVTGCRSQFIARYFNDNEVKQCGICDNCLKEKNSRLAAKEVGAIAEQILTAVRLAPLATEILLRQIPCPDEQIWKVIHYLQAEKKLTIDSEGNVHCL